MTVVKNVKKVKEINVLCVTSDKLPKEIKVPNTPRTYRDFIYGPISSICLEQKNENKVCLLYTTNSNIRFNANRYIDGYGIICGNIIIVGQDRNGNYKSLTKEQVTKYKKIFGEESIKELNTKIRARVLALRILRRQH